MIEVGEYVRTDTGCIGKVDTIYYAGKENRFYGEELFKNYYSIYYGKGEYSIYYGKGEYGRFAEERIIKHSKNIIDLIEVGDYVNGDKVEAVDYTEDEQGNYIDVLGTMEIDDDFAYPIILRNENIKSIVTHEQYKQIEYIVEE